MHLNHLHWIFDAHQCTWNTWKPDLYECRCVKVWMDFFTTNFLYFSHLHLFTFYQIKAEDKKKFYCNVLDNGNSLCKINLSIKCSFTFWERKKLTQMFYVYQLQVMDNINLHLGGHYTHIELCLFWKYQWLWEEELQ